jgi:excinuclease ABC subunit C
MLARRLAHPEWMLPALIVVDGGKAQIATAERVLRAAGIIIPVVGVVKDEHHHVREILGDAKTCVAHARAIFLANSEAHRFAITYHRVLRSGYIKKHNKQQ